MSTEYANAGNEANWDQHVEWVKSEVGKCREEQSR
jgi:hypothetical protein